jgi:signal peptidase I
MKTENVLVIFCIALIVVTFYSMFSTDLVLKKFTYLQSTQKMSENLNISIDNLNKDLTIKIPDNFNVVYSEVAPTGSMRPGISDYSILILNTNITENDLKIGDSIVFNCDNKLILHRIIDILKREKETEYVTKGDNNNIDDNSYFGCKTTLSDINSELIGVIF